MEQDTQEIKVTCKQGIYDMDRAWDVIATLINESVFFIWEPWPDGLVAIYVKPESDKYLFLPG